MVIAIRFKIMIDKVLKNLAHSFYPKNICSIHDKENYLQSCEYKNLSKTLNSFFEYKTFPFYGDLINCLKEDKFFEKVQDVTLLEWEDRCISLELDIIEGKTLDKICLHISLLVPYYVIYLLESEIELNSFKLKTVPKYNQMKMENIYYDKIKMLIKIVEKTTDYKKLPISLANYGIPDINFHDIEMGEFNLFNAFFLNENKLK